ncbi:MAG: hypothetical protein JSU96_06995, partial [Acidobacteriota bacterium]
ADQMKGERAPALMNLGWALTNLERTDEGLEILEEAAELGQFNFVGFADWPTENLDYYLARAYLDAGRRRDALDRILPLAVISRSEKALELLEEIHTAEGGEEADFASYVERQRQSVAKKVPEFTAFDYAGKSVSFEQFKGKVTLLAFWFPT